MTETARKIRFKVTGERMLQKVKELVHEGNVRRIVIQSEDDRTILEIPLTLGVVGAVLLPVWVAIGAIAALAANYTIEVEKVERAGPPAPAATAAEPEPVAQA